MNVAGKPWRLRYAAPAWLNHACLDVVADASILHGVGAVAIKVLELRASRLRTSSTAAAAQVAPYMVWVVCMYALCNTAERCFLV